MNRAADVSVDPIPAYRRLISANRLRKLSGFASTQAFVQGVGFIGGVVIVRVMDQTDYGHYTLALTMVGLACVLIELGLGTAVMAVGGPHFGQPDRLAAIMADAHRLVLRLSLVALVLLPFFAAMLAAHDLAPPSLVALLLLVYACTGLQVANNLALAMVRLRGDLVLQQLLEVGINLVKLSLVIGATAIALDAQVALAINALCAGVLFLMLRRHLRFDIGAQAAATGEFARPLREFVGRHAPNAIYYCLTGQIAIWLIGWLGSADRIAEVGALGRLALAFAVIGAVVTALVQPHVARARSGAELRAAFQALNCFFAAITTLLAAAALTAPQALLWILGPKYSDLHAEVFWMVLSASLSAWGAGLYAIGSARGWIVPGRVVVPAGVVTIAVSILAFDVATVRGSFMLNTAMAATAAVVTFVYVWRCVQRHTVAGATTGELR